MASGTELILAGAAVFATALACMKPVPSPASATENPCVAGMNGCGSYRSCPGNDVCGSASAWCGFTGCAVQGSIVARCASYTGGTYNTSTLCCEGGTYAGPSTVTVTITVMVGTGTCGNCEPVPPDEP